MTYQVYIHSLTIIVVMSVEIRYAISFVINALASFVGTELMLVTTAQHKFLLSKLCQVFHSNTLVVKILRSDSLDDNITFGLPSSSAITPDEPVLSTEEPDNSLNQIEDFSESNEEFSLTDDDSFSFDKIDYVEASPPDSELVSSEMMEIVTPEVGGIKASNDNPILFMIQTFLELL
nr:hypothetical protein [Tanacetum cinerariifolium]